MDGCPDVPETNNNLDTIPHVAVLATNREAFRGALVLMDQGAISRGGLNGPYAESTRQVGFVEFGASHVMRAFASLEIAQSSSWYQKWNVHLFARPEVRGRAEREIRRSLM